MRARTLNLSSSEHQELRTILHRDPRPYLRERASALLQIAAGSSVAAVARGGLLRARHRETVLIWLNEFNTHASCARVPPRGALFPPQDTQRASLLEQLHQSPRAWGEPRSRWTLRLMSLHLDEVRGLSQSGVWRRLQKWRLTRRRTRAHQTSPDPAYRAKVRLLALNQQAAARGELELLYGDEHTYYRQPLKAQVWHPKGGGGAGQPTRARSCQTNTKRRTLAALNARTGQVIWKGGSKTRVPAICLWLKQVRAAYPDKRVVLVWDNWPVHSHQKVLACAWEQQIESVWLPTYAPWLNPIEKMWKWLVADVLSAHRHCDDGSSCAGRSSSSWNGSPSLPWNCSDTADYCRIGVSRCNR